MAQRRLPDRRQVAATPDEVWSRLGRSMLEMADLWFASRQAMRAWDRSVAPLYLRRIAKDRAEIGPRLGNLSAARWCPVVTLSIEPHGEGSVLTLGAPRLPGTALLLWGVVAALNTGWALAIVLAWRTGGEEGRGWPLCLALYGVLGMAQAVAWGPGLASLRGALPALWRAVEVPTAGQDDW